MSNLTKFIEREVAEILSPVAIITSIGSIGLFFTTVFFPWIIAMVFGAKEFVLWALAGVDYNQMNIVFSLIFFTFDGFIFFGALVMFSYALSISE